MAPTIVLLHGFTHTGASWQPVIEALGERYRAIAPDIRGHGAATELEPVTLEAVIGDVAGLTEGPFTLVGYSMGGRIALHVALALGPDRVERLVLIGASPGVADDGQRGERVACGRGAGRGDRGAGRSARGGRRDGRVRAPLGDRHPGAGWPASRGAGAGARRSAAEHAGGSGPGAAGTRDGRATAALGPPGRADDAGHADRRRARRQVPRDRRRDGRADPERDARSSFPATGHAVHLEAPAAVADAVGAKATF